MFYKRINFVKIELLDSLRLIPNTILRLSFFVYVKEGILTFRLNISFIELVRVKLKGFKGLLLLTNPYS